MQTKVLRGSRDFGRKNLLLCDEIESDVTGGELTLEGSDE